MRGNLDHNDLLTSQEYSSAAEEQFNKFARFYDDDYRHYQDDFDLICAIADDCGDPILELGCGTGRVLLPLAERGHSVSGIDISPNLLTVAQGKIDQLDEPSRLTLVHGDIRSVVLPTTNFRFAYCVSNTLMHCTTQNDQLMVLQNAFRHLAVGGLLLIDLFNPDLVALSEVAGLQELADSWRTSSGSQVLKWSIRTVDPATQLQETCFIYEELTKEGNAKKTACPFTLRYLWPSEGKLLLELAGFELLSVWGSFDCEAHHSGSERLIFLAQKP